MARRTPTSPLVASLVIALAAVACGPGTSVPAASPSAEPSPDVTLDPGPSAAARDPAAYVEGAPYEQVLDPADFVAVVDNPYFPLPPGTTYMFVGGSERIETAVTHDTKVILGITAVVVHDQVFDNGELIEDTFDWYAQDRWGNVWYLGEATRTLAGGVVTSTEGSWEAGVDGAQPGIVMLAQPQVGDTYRQEFYAGHAEDLAKVIEIGGSLTVAAGAHENTLVTEDWTPLEPDILEFKTYAPGVGFIFERFVKGGEGTIELVEIRPGG